MIWNPLAATLAFVLISSPAFAGEVKPSLAGLKGVCLGKVVDGPALRNEFNFMNVEGPLEKPAGAAGIPVKWVDNDCGPDTFGPSRPLLEARVNSSKYTNQKGRFGFYIIEVQLVLSQTVRAAGGKAPFRAITWMRTTTLYVDMETVQAENDVRDTLTAMSEAFVLDFVAANPSLKAKK